MDLNAVPLIEFRNVTTRFGELYANRDISLPVREGEVLAIAGENGAGKSTLMNVLFGRVRPETGSVFLRGKPLALRGPRDAIRAGIGMVHQNLLFSPQLTVLENIILGSEPSRSIFLKRGEAAGKFHRLRESFGFNLDPDLPAGELPFAGRQQAELLRILYRGADILILDEPTSFLGPHEVERLLGLLRSLREGGKTILFISHRMNEVFAVADRIAVLRRGRLAATLDAEKTDADEIARLMVGADAAIPVAPSGGDRVRPLPEKPRTPVLKVREVSVLPSGADTKLEKLSFTVEGGEIFGIAGIVGNGQRLLARTLAGRETPESGAIFLDGHEITALPVGGRVRAGMCRLPENPTDEAFLPENPLWENFLLGSGRRSDFSRLGFIRKRDIVRFTADKIRENGIAARGPEEPLSSLSGGNRQKAALARMLCRAPRAAILEQPSRGLDLYASARMRDDIFALSETGAAIVVFSYDLDELITLCDRIAVLFRGRIMGIARREEFSREVLGRWMVGIG